jgi:hypothetical protein
MKKGRPNRLSRSRHRRPARGKPIPRLFAKVERVLTIAYEQSGKEDLQFWRSRSVADRVYGIENLRRQIYAYDEKTTPRLQRILEITQ